MVGHYNIEQHFAHSARQDGRHSPLEVLRGVLGRTSSEEVLSWVLYATQFTRHLDKHGYVKFRNWRFFGEDGLTGEEVSVWVYEGTLKIEYQTTALSLYSITFQQDHEHIAEVKNLVASKPIFAASRISSGGRSLKRSGF